MSVNQINQQEGEYEELDTFADLKKDMPESYDVVRPPPQPKSSTAPPSSDEYAYITSSTAQEVVSNHGDDRYVGMHQYHYSSVILYL